MNLRLAGLSSIAALLVLSLGNHAVADSPTLGQTCFAKVSAAGGEGTITTVATRRCHAGAPTPGKSPGGPVFRTIDCGPATVDLPAAIPGQDCSLITALCRLAPGQSPPPNTTTTITLEQLPNGTWTVIGYDCAAPARTGSTPLAMAAHDQAQRLVPRPGIGVGPPGGVTLVNIQTLFWLSTPATQSLGTVHLLGQTVDLQISITDVTWTFGDGHTDHTTDPGTPTTAPTPATPPNAPATTATPTPPPDRSPSPPPSPGPAATASRAAPGSRSPAPSPDCQQPSR